MRIFITGTAGFIGFHCAQRLLDDGHEVFGFDGMTPYYDVSLKEARHAILEAYPAFSARIAMLEDGDELKDSVAAAKPDVIIHLAAQAGVRYSFEVPEAFVQANLVGSWKVLDAAREAKVDHLLMASTSSIYGANRNVPFRETDKSDGPLSTYAATKRGVEMLAHSQSHLHTIPTTAFRFFTVYGPWGRPDMALFKFVGAMLRDEPIDIYGHGKMSRDFTYIDDLVEAIVRLIPHPPSEAERSEIDSLSLDAPFRTINIGAGQPTELMAFVDTVETALGKRAEKIMKPMQEGDVPRTYASCDLLEELTGYRPSTPLKTGVEAFVAWYLDQYGREGRKA